MGKLIVCLLIFAASLMSLSLAATCECYCFDGTKFTVNNAASSSACFSNQQKACPRSSISKSNCSTSSPAPVRPSSPAPVRPSSPTPVASSGEKGSFPVWAIVLIVIGVILLIACIAAVAKGNYGGGEVVVVNSGPSYTGFGGYNGGETVVVNNQGWGGNGETVVVDNGQRDNGGETVVVY